MKHASWLDQLVYPELLTKAAQALAKQIRKDAKHFNISAIAIRGMSGAVIGAVVSHLTGIPLIIVRKSDGSHSEYRVECSESLDGCGYVIIDDLIFTGETVAKIVHEVERENPSLNLQKIYLYHDSMNKDFKIGSIDYKGCYNAYATRQVVPVWSIERTEES